GTAASYVPADSAAGFAAAVRGLEDPDVWRERSAASVHQAATFSWERSARELMDVAEEIMARRSAGAASDA
ncbi:MAG TPA: glycosyltransferase family 1 protein, partial [Micrococcaceae bacterium]